MLDLTRIISLLLFTYVGAPIALFLGTARFLRIERDDATRLLALTLGLGPIAIVWCFTQLLRFWPGRSDAFYIAATLAVFGLCATAGLSKISLLSSVIRNVGTKIRNLRLSESPAVVLLVVGTGIGVASMIGIAVVLPLYANDPLEYATLARMIYNRKSIGFYPMVEADPEFGFYFPSTHALGFPNLYAWHYLIQGTAETAGLIKLPSALYGAATCVLLAYSLRPAGAVAATTGALLLITTPLYHRMGIDCHVDPLRLYTFLAAFLWLSESLHKLDLRTIFMTGLATGLSMFSHSIGVLTLPFVGFVYLLRARIPLSKRILHCTVLTVAALALTGQRYWDNYQSYGSPVQDLIPLYDACTQLEYDQFLRDHRGIASVSERITNGVFKGFSAGWRYGWSYWIALAGVVLAWRRIRATRDGESLAWAVVLFHALIVATVVLGVDLIIKNDRYLLTVQPMIAFLGAVIFQQIYDLIPPPRLRLRQLLYTWTIFIVLALKSDIDFAFDHFPIPQRLQYERDLDMLADSAYDIARFGLIRQMNTETAPDSVVYTTRMSDVAFYGKRPYIRDIDTRAIPLCETQTAEGAFAELQRQSVDYVYMTDYKVPMFYRTGMHRLLADPRYTAIAGEAGRHRLYALHSSPRQVQFSTVFETAGFVSDPARTEGPAQWTLSSHRKRYEPASWLTTPDGSLQITSDMSTHLYLGDGGIREAPQSPTLIPNQLYTLQATVSGSGYAQLLLLDWNASGSGRRQSLWYGALDDVPFDIAGQFTSQDTGGPYRIALVHVGPGELSIRKVRLAEVEVAPETVTQEADGA